MPDGTLSPSPHIAPTYGRAPLAFERGEGCWLYTAEGEGYLDFASGIAVNALGHAHPVLVEALRDQAGKLWHTSNLYEIPHQRELAEKLVAHSFADLVFFCNSGAEALEGCFKAARRYHHAHGNPQKYRIICASNSFHGRTLATIAAANNPKHLDGFGPAVDGFDHVAFNNLNETRAAITEETAAILVEPIQGEGGITPADLDYLRALRSVCDEFGLLLIYDEVQCGMGRTGRLFAHEWADGEADPDLIAVAKGIGGGFPLGCFMGTSAAMEGISAGTHGTTYGGNPLASRVGCAVVDLLLEPGFLDGVYARSMRLWDGLGGVVAAHPSVYELHRGAGLMQGLKVAEPHAAGDLVARLRDDHRLLTVPAGQNVIRILPPLVVSDAEIDQALAAFGDVAAAVSA